MALASELGPALQLHGMTETCGECVSMDISYRN